MKKIIWFLALSLIYNFAEGQTLKLISYEVSTNKKMLYCRYNNELIKVKELKDDDHFQGYDIIDSTHVFFAFCYYAGGGFATSVMSYDLKARKAIFLGVVEKADLNSWFEYNSSNRTLVFFGYPGGIYTIKLGEVQKTKPKLILKTEKTVIPFWTSKGIIGYVDNETGKTCYIKREHKK